MVLRSHKSGVVFCIAFAGLVSGQSVHDEGIPVNDPLVIAKCGSCHARDEHGNMQRVSWERTTPEGWQDVLKRMVLVNGLTLSQPEARSIVKYLSARHGLAPEEAKPVMYDIERRIREETNIPSENLRNDCARCHSFARALSWRRSSDDWKQFISIHTARYKVKNGEEALAFLAKTAPLHTPEWDAWSARAAEPNPTGRWLVTASILGRGKYFGEMKVDPDGNDGFKTSVHLTSVNDGTTLVRTGLSAVYAGYAWRGRSKGTEPAGTAPEDPSSQLREVLWIAPDQSMAEGRWFWGEYQEFGFDVKMRRPSSDPTLMIVDRTALKIGSQANRIRLIGDNLPASVTPADLKFGAGVSVRRIVSHTSGEIAADVDVASDARPGKRDVAVGPSVVPGGVAIYDRVDYIKVTPESAMAAFGDRTHARGYQQFEAIGYQNGPDGKAHTDDDLELGPVDVTWSLEVFYAAQGSNSDVVGKVTATGFFTPVANGPNSNFDVWVVATAKGEKDKNGAPLTGKGYLVVTVPTYTFNGRQYVRDLDRWVDDGPAAK